MSQLENVLVEINKAGNVKTPEARIAMLRGEAWALIDEIRHRERQLQFQGCKTPKWKCPCLDAHHG